jgi:hypothetical protein
MVLNCFGNDLQQAALTSQKISSLATGIAMLLAALLLGNISHTHRLGTRVRQHFLSP